MSDSPGLDGFHSYEPPKSLWNLVEKSVLGHEREEIKNILGISLVEQSIELHDEIQTLREIWRDYRKETEGALLRTNLPEPPHVRERLKLELRFFVESLRQKATESGRDPNAILTRHNTEVIHYALDDRARCDSRSASRQSNASKVSSDGRSSRASHMSEDVEAMNERLNYLKVDDVVDHLRKALEDEVSYLLEDVVFLQTCLEGEANYRCESSLEKEPTLKDLREERAKLEQDFLFSESSVLSETSPEILALSPLRRDAQPSKKHSSTPPSCISKTGPIKRVVIRASHQSPTQVLTKSTKIKRHEHSGLQIDAINSGHSPSPKASGDAITNLSIDGTILAKLKSEPPAHISIRTSALPKIAKLVDIGSIQAPLKENQVKDSALKTCSIRRSSAQRFRSMVLECRDSP